MLTLTRQLTLALAVAAPGLGQATVLTFDTFGTGGIAAYGDNVAGSPQGGSTYGAGGGWTPNVTLGFATACCGQPTIWASGYGGNTTMHLALGHGSFDVPFTLTFTPDPGHAVRVDAFDIATWLSGNYQTQIRMWDANGSFAAPNLLDYDVLFQANAIYSLGFIGNPYSQGPVNLWLSNLGSTGIDNLQFSQTQVVPEPGTWALMALGLAGIAGHGQRLRRRTAA